jgi:hypothetical protein
MKKSGLISLGRKASACMHMESPEKLKRSEQRGISFSMGSPSALRRLMPLVISIIPAARPPAKPLRSPKSSASAIITPNRSIYPPTESMAFMDERMLARIISPMEVRGGSPLNVWPLSAL